MRYLTLKIAIAFILACASAASADSITLKPSVRLKADATMIRLGDIAELQGEYAATLSTIVIAENSNRQAVAEIGIREIRAKLDEAGANWGRTNLNGRSVVVRSARESGAAAPMAMTPVSLDETAVAEQRNSMQDELLAADIIHESTLRGTIAALIANQLQLDPANLRLTFQRADATLLTIDARESRFEVQPLNSSSSDRINLAVRKWHDRQVQETKYISVLPQLRMQAAALQRDVRKDQVITDADIVNSEQWLTPAQAALVAPQSNVAGRIAAKNMKAGEVIREANIQRQTLIERGDLVIVRCLVGGVAISLQAEARSDGSQGEAIEFRKQGERDTFLACVTRRGEAVLDLSHR
jgi:flagella basal body P-ring formation protein FlgA